MTNMKELREKILDILADHEVFMDMHNPILRQTSATNLIEDLTKLLQSQITKAEERVVEKIKKPVFARSGNGNFYIDGQNVSEGVWLAENKADLVAKIKEMKVPSDLTASNKSWEKHQHYKAGFKRAKELMLYLLSTKSK